MKKSYISPEILVVRIDSEELCLVIAASPEVVTLSLDDSTDKEDEIAAPTYRTNLWN